MLGAVGEGELLVVPLEVLPVVPAHPARKSAHVHSTQGKKRFTMVTPSPTAVPTVAHYNPGSMQKFQNLFKNNWGLLAQDGREGRFAAGCISMEMHRVFLIRSAP